MVDLLERLEVLLEQELLSYRTEDYLDPGFQQRLQVSYADKNESRSSSFSTYSSSTSASGINEVWREKICEWSYQVIDHFDFSREVVSISIHYLDRYLSTRAVNKNEFQLAAMTALYLAIKLYEPTGALGMKSMSQLSRGLFLVEQMEEMEMTILRALSWKVHPPTVNCFAKHILFLLPYTSVTTDVRYDILEKARFLLELSVIDYFFVMHRPSVVALAALLNAMEAVPGASESCIRDLNSACMHVAGLDQNRPEVLACRHRLHLLYSEGGYTGPEIVEHETRSDAVSPVCVSYGVNPHGAYYPQQDLVHDVEDEPKQHVYNFSGVDVNESHVHLSGMKRSTER